ncbi:hypothetical protein OAP54_03280 [Planktomarina temperata]|nr:hypothetical protein [Planktomarina temperata]
MRNFVTYGCIAIALSTWANIGAAATQCSTASTFSSHSGAGNEFGEKGNCSKDAESFKLKVYEFAICTGHATVADQSMCTTLFQDTAGSDLILSKGASLPLGADVTLAEGTYTHAYIHVDNVMYLKVSHEFSSVRRDRGGTNSGIYCYSNGVDRAYDVNDNLVNSIITCSNTAPTTATNLPTKETLSFAADDGSWVSSMVDNATGTNLYMLKADGRASTSLATDDTILASQDITDVVISPTTAGMNIAFTVTDTVGLMIQEAGAAANAITCPAGTGDCVVDSAWIGMQFLVTAK